MDVQYGMETAMDKPCTVALEDAAEVPTPTRISAEVRFITTLERVLDGPVAVAGVYRAWTQARQKQASDTDADRTQLAIRWPVAFDMARQAGLQDLGDRPSAHFAVRLERSHTS